MEYEQAKVEAEKIWAEHYSAEFPEQSVQVSTGDHGREFQVAVVGTWQLVNGRRVQAVSPPLCWDDCSPRHLSREKLEQLIAGVVSQLRKKLGR